MWPFRPAWNSPDAKKALKEVVDEYDREMLVKIALKANNAEVRKAAVDRLNYQQDFYEVVCKTNDHNVCLKALNKLTDQRLLERIAKNNKLSDICVLTVSKLTDQSALEAIAKTNMHSDARLAAVKKIKNQSVIEVIAKTDSNKNVRLETAGLIKNQSVIEVIAKKDSDRDVRAKAVQQLTAQSVIEDIARTDNDKDVRLTAVRLIKNQAVLEEVIKIDSDIEIRLTALKQISNQTVIGNVAKNNGEREVCIAAVKRLNTEAVLADVVKHAYNEEARKAAIEKMTDQHTLAHTAINNSNRDICIMSAERLSAKRYLNEVVKNATFSEVRKIAAQKLDGKHMLKDVAMNDSSWEVRKAAVENRFMTDQGVLASIAKNDKDKDVRKAAVENEKLTDPVVLAYVAKYDRDNEVRKAAKARLPEAPGNITYMKLIHYNPYRIIGCLVGISAKEKERVVRRLKQFIEAGRTPEAGDSFSEIIPAERTVETVSEALSNLNLDSDRMCAALFWFYEGNMTDRQAFEAMKAGDFNRAVAIWSKLASSDISQTNVSAFSNLATLYLSGFLKDAYPGDFMMEQGISLKLKFLDSPFANDLKQKATDETYQVTANELQLIFLNQVRKEVESHAQDLFLRIIIKLSFSAKDVFLKSYIQSPIEQIDSKINETQVIRKKKPANAVEAAKSLLKDTRENLTLLELVLKTSDIRYTSANDSIAEEILQCGIYYFNFNREASEKDKKHKTTNDNFTKNALEICREADSIALGNKLKNRCRETIDNIRLYSEQREIQRQIDQLTDLTGKHEKLPQTTGNAIELISTAKQLLIRLKMSCAKNNGLNDIYINISTHIASEALNICVKEINELQKKNNDFELFKRKVNETLELIARIEAMELQQDFRNNRLAQNRDGLLETKKNFDVIALQYFINAYDYRTQTVANAKTFLTKAIPFLVNIQSSFGAYNDTYISLSTKVAADALNMCVAEINELQKNDADHKLLKSKVDEALEVMNQIQSMHILTDFKINLFKPNCEVLENIKNNFDAGELMQLVNAYEKAPQTVDNAKEYIKKAQPVLARIKETMGVQNNEYIAISTKVAAHAQSMCIAEINELQNNDDDEIYAFERTLSGALHVMTDIGWMDLSPDFKINLFKPNSDALENLYHITKLKMLIKRYCYNLNTLKNVKEYLSEAKPLLQKLNSSSGANNEVYLALSTRIADDCQAICVKLVNERQYEIRRGNYYFAEFLNPVIDMMSAIGDLDMQKEFRENYLKNCNALYDLYKQIR